jgi:two-component system phosphate regulon sensor histidine kinase PhoR
MGIEAHEQCDVFQKFVRGTAAKKAGIPGTGIGLAIVKEIIDAMDGHIHLESAVGAGSTFTIVLPLVNTGETRS